MRVLIVEDDKDAAGFLKEALERESFSADFLEAHMHRLRDKLDGRGGPVIETVRGVGYRLKTSKPPKK